jgi:hypothetical protein
MLISVCFLIGLNFFDRQESLSLSSTKKGATMGSCYYAM